MSKHYLESLFAPRSVAVVFDKAYEAIGSQVLTNLAHAGFAGRVYPVSGDVQAIGDRRTVANLGGLGESVDLVVIAAQASEQPALLRACGEVNAAAAVILSGGFSEAQQRGRALQDELAEIARSCDIALVEGMSCSLTIKGCLGTTL